MTTSKTVTTDQIITGTDRSEVLRGGNGHDRIIGGSGNDVIYGGDGNDYVDAGAGNDVVYAGNGNDTVFGGLGNDILYGQDGDDLLDGGDGNDFLNGGDGNDTLLGGAGNDDLDGNDGNDVLDGGAGNDHLHGNDGNDIVRGGAGDDWIDGDDGDDYLDGGAGNDRVEGGNGNDVLAFRMSEHGAASTAACHNGNVYDGGDNVDTLRLILTRDEWLRADVQADVARYVSFLNAEANTGLGRLSAKLGKNEFFGTFDFSVFDLTVQRVEKFEVVVDGLTLDPRDEAVIARADAITTDEDHASLAFNLLANDSVPDLVRSVTVGNAAHGTVALTQNYADPANPVATVVYTPNAAYYQYLAQGEKAIDTFTYTVTDTDGDVSTATVTVTITGNNDGPAIVSGTYTGAVVEDAAATLASSGAITFSDVDLTDTHSVSVGAARVAVTGAIPAGFAPAGGFGTLTAVVVENTTDQNNQGAINWRFAADNMSVQKLAAGQVATQVYTLTLTDRFGATTTQDVTITLTGTNDVPTVTSAMAAGAVTEDGITAVAGAIAFADVDLIDTHAVRFTPQSGGYLGTFATVIDNVATGDGAGNVRWTFAVDNAAIQNLAQGETLTQKYTVTITDNNGAAVTQVVTVTITGTNDAPVAVADTAALLEDAAITGSVALNDSDVDNGATRTFSLNAPIAGLTLNADGSYRFDAADTAYQALAQGEVRTVVASYTVTDQFGADAMSTLTITVTGTNDAPVAVADTAALLEDAAITGSVALNDSDVDNGATRTFVLNAPIAGLTLNADGSYRFDAADTAYQALAQGEVRTVVASYTVTDQFGATATSTLTITVTGTNDAPVAVADTAALLEDAAITGSVALNDSDVDNGATRTFALNAPIAGLTLNADGSYRFDAADTAYQALAQGEVRTVVASYTVTDQFGATATSTLTITVTGTNDAPVAVADTAALLEDAAITGSVALNDSDVDNGATRTFALNAPVAGLTLNADGSYRFDAADTAYQALAQGEVRTVVASYTVTDQFGATATSTLTITVTGTNDAPVAVADTATLLEDAAITGSVALNDSDVDNGATRTFALNAPVAGLTLNADGSYRFDAADTAYQALAQGEVRTVVASYTVTDEFGATATSTLTITVTGTNDAPVAVADTAALLEDAAITGSVALNDSDVDNGATRTFALNAPVAGLTLNADGSYRFDAADTAYQALAQGEVRTVVASYTVTDQFGADAMSTLTITVTGTNDAPVAVADVLSAVEDQPAVTGSVAINDSDVDNGATRTFALNTAIAGLTFNADGSYRFDAGNAAYQALAKGETQVLVASYTVTDDQGSTATSTLTITVSGTNDAPVARVDIATAVEDALPVTGTVAANDYDVDNGAALSFRLSNPVAGLTLAADGGYVFNPADAAYQALAAGQTQTVVAAYEVTDEQGTTSFSALVIVITGTNDAPVVTSSAIAARGSVSEAGNTDAGAIVAGVATASGALTSSDVDTGATASWSGSAAGTYGAFTIGADGRWTYTLDNASTATQALAEGQSVTDTFTATVTDDRGATATQVVTVTVAGTNDSPVVTSSAAAATGAVVEAGNNDDGSILAGTPNATGTLTSSDVDTGATTTWTGTVAGTYGNFAITAGGVWTYTLDNSKAATQALGEGASVTETFNARVTDDKGAIATTPVTVTIAGSNDAPTIIVGSTALNTIVPTNTNALSPLGEPNTAYYGQTFVATGNSLTSVAVPLDWSSGSEGMEFHFVVAVANIVNGQFTVGAVLYESGTITVPVDADQTFDLFSVDTGGVTLTQGQNYVLLVDAKTTRDGVSGLATWQFGSNDPTGMAVYYNAPATGTTRAQDFAANWTEYGSGDLGIRLSYANTGAAGAVTEIADGAAGEGTANLTANGTIAFADVDLGDSHSAGFVPVGTATLGTFALGAVNQTGDTVGWTFTVADATIEYLAAGQVVTQTYAVRITDDKGASVVQNVAITITGTNDAPVVTGAVLGNATEDGTAVTLNALANASDVDTGAVLNVVNIGTLPAGVTYDAASKAFTLDPANAAYNSLAAGQQQVVTVTYGVSDGSITTAASVRWTVTGANDAPTVIAMIADQTVAEDTAWSFKVPTGSFADVDAGTTLSYTATLADGTTLPTWLTFNATTQTFSGTPPQDYNGVIDLTVIASDGVASANDTFRLTVTAVDDAPVLTMSGANGLYVENAAPKIVDGALTLVDVDGPSLNGAVVSITGNLNAAQDRLVFTDQNGITGSYNAATGQLALTGLATAAQYQQALRSVSYANSSDAPTTGDRTITFAVTPNGASSQYYAANGHFYQYIAADGVSFAAAKAAAEASTLFGYKGYLATVTSAGENSFIQTKLTNSGWIGASDAAVEGDWRWVTGPEAGQLFYQGTAANGGAVNGAYNAWAGGEPNQFGDEDYAHFFANGTWNDYPGGGGGNFVNGYIVEYGGMPGDAGLGLTGTATVRVQAVNDAPVAVADVVTVAEGVVVTGSVAANDSDVDSANLAYALSNTVAGLTLNANGGFSFDANNAAYNSLAVGQSRVVTANYTVSDGVAAPVASTLTLTVTGTNDAPLVSGPVTLTANRLGNGGFDSSPDFSGWTVSTTSSGTDYVYSSTARVDRSGGVIAGDNAVAVLDYTAQVPNGFGTGQGPSITSAAFAGSAGDKVRFIYQLSSGGDEAIGTGYIRDAATGQVVQTIFNYQTPFVGSTGVQTVELTLASSGNYTIDFRVGSYDASGGRYIGARLDVGFAGILATGVSEDVPFTFSTGRALLLANATDVDAGDTLTIGAFSTTSAKGVSIVMTADGQLTIDATNSAQAQSLTQGQTTTDTFTYQISDGHGGLTTATATYTLSGADEPQSAQAINAFSGGGNSFGYTGGDDVLFGTSANDVLTGGAGNDRFVLAKGGGADVIMDFVGGVGTGDVIELRGMGFGSFGDVKAAAFQAADGVHIDLHNGDSLVLTGVNLSTLVADDFLIA